MAYNELTHFIIVRRKDMFFLRIWFHVALFPCWTIFVLHSFIVALLLLYSFHIALCLYRTIFIFRYFFHFSCSIRAALFSVALSSCCILFILHFFRVGLFLCFTFSYCTLFSCYALFMLFFFCVALFSCCSFPCFTIFILRFLYCTLFMLHCYAWIFFRTGFLDKTSEWLSLFHMLCKSCNLEILLNNFLPNSCNC